MSSPNHAPALGWLRFHFSCCVLPVRARHVAPIATETTLPVKLVSPKAARLSYRFNSYPTSGFFFECNSLLAHVVCMCACDSHSRRLGCRMVRRSTHLSVLELFCTAEGWAKPNQTLNFLLSFHRFFFSDTLRKRMRTRPADTWMWAPTEVKANEGVAELIRVV